jgi:hypothetical protein
MILNGHWRDACCKGSSDAFNSGDLFTAVASATIVLIVSGCTPIAASSLLSDVLLHVMRHAHVMD